MALIDVSDLLLDPDFVDPVMVIRRTVTISAYGENTIVESSTINTYASVQPADFKQIQRLPQSLQLADVRSFFIKLEVVQDSSGDYPDIFVWLGQRYQVQTSAPWLNFGAGWNEAVCVREKPS